MPIVDVTTLEGANTPGQGRRAARQGPPARPTDPAVLPVAAVCVYPDPVAVARRELAGSTIAAAAVASVATAFPSGRAPPTVKLADVAAAVEAGVHEMDIVIDRA